MSNSSDSIDQHSQASMNVNIESAQLSEISSNDNILQQNQANTVSFHSHLGNKTDVNHTVSSSNSTDTFTDTFTNFQNISDDINMRFLTQPIFSSTSVNNSANYISDQFNAPQKI